ncbi:MAG TPA: glycosyltransferase family 87 protein, partial [Terriglobales bacterium]|nr:glycosyltransferase family 87 protein [Terriglobales bacterium]
MSNEAAITPGFTAAVNDGTLGLLMAAIVLFTAVVWTARGANVEKTDFALTYVGAKIVHDGLGSRLYDLTLQKQMRDSLFQSPSPLVFQHPPFEALLLSPLASYPFRTAYLIWGSLNAAIWMIIMVALRSRLPWPSENLAYLALWFLFAPLGVALYQGQSSVLLLALFAVCFTQLERGREFAAGMALGLGLIKFQFALPLALIFLFRRRWSFLCGFAATSAVLGWLSIFAVGWRGLASYVRLLFAISSHPQDVSYGSGVDMPTIHGFVYAVLGRWLSTAGLAFVAAVLSVLLLTWMAWRWQSVKPGPSHALMFAAAIAASLLAGS